MFNSNHFNSNSKHFHCTCFIVYFQILYRFSIPDFHAVWIFLTSPYAPAHTQGGYTYNLYLNNKHNSSNTDFSVSSSKQKTNSHKTHRLASLFPVSFTCRLLVFLVPLYCWTQREVDSAILGSFLLGICWELSRKAGSDIWMSVGRFMRALMTPYMCKVCVWWVKKPSWVI